MTKKDNILKIITLSGWEEQTKQLLDIQLEFLKEEDQEVFEAIKKHKLFEKIINEDLTDYMVELYDRFFNEKQVKKLLNFYEDVDLRNIFKDASKMVEDLNQRIEEIIEKRLNEIPELN